MRRRRPGVPAKAREPPAYRPCRYKRSDAMEGPAGVGGTFVDVTGPGGETVRALLGGCLGWRNGRTVYAVLDHRPVEDESRRPAHAGARLGARKLLDKLDSPDRNVGGVPTDKYRLLLRDPISAEDLRAIMRVLDNKLELTRNPFGRRQRRLMHMIHQGRAGRDGRRLALYVTADGRLYNELAGMTCPEGHRKILDYKRTREIRCMRKYVELTVCKVMAEIGGRLEFVEQTRRRHCWPPFRYAGPIV